MCVIGITDYFQMDVLGFRRGLKPELSTIFTSTVGNINTYTAYVALLIGLASAMFATSKSLMKAIWHHICMVVTFFAIIMGCSDNAYLALGALFGPFVLFRSRIGIRRYLVMVASFFTVVQCIDLLTLLWGAVALICCESRRLQSSGELGSLPIRIWGAVVAFAAPDGMFGTV